MPSIFFNNGLKGKNNIRIAFVFVSTFLILSSMSMSITIFPMSTVGYRVNSANHHTILDVKAQPLPEQAPINSSNIEQVTNNSTSNSPPPRITNLTNIFDRVDQSVVQVTGSSQTLGSALGSGFVYDKEGHIVTNYHVISGIDQTADGIGSENDDIEFSITFLNGSMYNARVIGTDADSDLAVLKISDNIS
ncbi:MAG: trypsin-like peptidase domain-containing protein, partial [Nitrososphaeraceae archaeon]